MVKHKGDSHFASIHYVSDIFANNSARL